MFVYVYVCVVDVVVDIVGVVVVGCLLGFVCVVGGGGGCVCCCVLLLVVVC